MVYIVVRPVRSWVLLGVLLGLSSYCIDNLLQIVMMNVAIVVQRGSSVGVLLVSDWVTSSAIWVWVWW